MAEVDPRQREDGLKVVVHRKLCWKADVTLVSAVKDGSLDCVRALLHRGVHTEQVDEIGLTPLLAAARAGNTAAIEVLLDAGADINSYGHTTWNALHFAAHLGDSATIETLVTRGGDLTARTAHKGKSPLHIAAGHAEAGAVQDLLLRWGADETQLDGRGRSAFDIAGTLKNVFERGRRHSEKVERVKLLLANAPRDRRWIRRRAVVMLVSRIRGEIAIARERRCRTAESKGAKKRGGGAAAAAAGAGVNGAGETAGQRGDQLAASAPASAAAAAEDHDVLWDVMRNGASAASGEEQARLPHGMEAFRDAVFRLGGEDDEGIFRSVVGFL
eukprot:g5076.t1